MTKTVTLQLTDVEFATIGNALNYFGNGCSSSECSTLLGMQQDDVRTLLQKFLAMPVGQPETLAHGSRPPQI